MDNFWIVPILLSVTDMSCWQCIRFYQTQKTPSLSSFYREYQP